MLLSLACLVGCERRVGLWLGIRWGRWLQVQLATQDRMIRQALAEKSRLKQATRECKALMRWAEMRRPPSKQLSLDIEDRDGRKRWRRK